MTEFLYEMEKLTVTYEFELKRQGQEFGSSGWWDNTEIHAYVGLYISKRIA